ncbi:glycerophosphoryl diester phosphodiesterase [Acinetobacter calcoaceticus]|uniref:glycerophosphodiester phosphodiesterase n=1 Tax=Acinetobacter calcoaceticus TaxID=471 RepID=A0A4R1Y564_ACICA|nr:glycerophosphoryl diester phosphodiesterase [Acinetobacter calcoaceticus]
MFKKLILVASLVTIAGCNESDDASTGNPNYTEPKVIVIGHRGASALRPEHTLAAYQKAMDDGADFIEPDLVPTKDGFLVARHENEIGGTSNVSTLPQFAQRQFTKTIDGVTLTGWFSEDFTLSELNQIKARERIPEIRPDNTQYNDQSAIPTLDQIIELAENHYKKTGKVVGLYIETKHPTYFQKLNLGMEDPLLNTLSKYKYTRDIAPIYLQSFEVSNLKYLKDQLKLHKSLKHAKIIQLYGNKNDKPADVMNQASQPTYAEMTTKSALKNVAKYADGVGPSKDYIIANTSAAKPTSFVKDAHAAGLKVHPYTLRPENEFLPPNLKCKGPAKQRCETGANAEYELFFKAGVDGVFTDDPALGRKALDAYLKANPSKK